MKISKILILGSNGFLGASLRKKLAKDKNFKIFNPKKSELDLLSLKAVKKFLSLDNYDFVVNCAANVGSVHYVNEFPADTICDNMQMSLNIYYAIRNTYPKTIILNIYSNCCYSGSVVNQYEKQFLKGEVHESVVSYGSFKRFLYLIAKTNLKQYKIRSINLMFPSIYGPGDSLDPYKTHAMNGIIIRALQNKKNKINTFKIWGTGKPVRNWLYIDDAVNSIIISLKKKLITDFPINIVNDKPISINQIVKTTINKIDAKMKVSKDIRFEDGVEARILKPGIFKKKFPNFKFTNYKDGIIKTISYYEKKICTKKRN